MNAPIRVVIDTNLWISFLIGKRLSRLKQLIIQEQVIVLFSEELFDEFIEVVHRPKFRKYFSSEAIHELITLLDLKAIFVPITEHFLACRDSKDNFLLDLCFAGNTDYLVTGDSDLLELYQFRQTTILDYRAFEKIVQGM
jgi:putative PIN family toxin of toxin-antitoxin system